MDGVQKERLSDIDVSDWIGVGYHCGCGLCNQAVDARLALGSRICFGSNCIAARCCGSYFGNQDVAHSATHHCDSGGESLINDATGLVAYRMALAAAVATAAGEFSVMETIFTFFESALGGILIGLIGGWIAVYVHRQLDDPVIETTLTLLTPYAVYMPCEALHVSGVWRSLPVACSSVNVPIG